jgi:hypothetical protein
MALKLKKITLKNGIEINEPYFKITLVSYNDEFKEISYAGAVYYSKETRERECTPINELRVSGNYHFEDKMANLYEEAYRHLKSEAEKIKGMTREEIAKLNEEKFNRAALSMGPVEGIIDGNNLLFVDAEDC